VNSRLKPSFLIIGAQRAGTTSLYSYLTAHPQIAPAARKEVHFFDVHYPKGEQWYWEQFPTCDGGGFGPQITGEASPYYLFHPLAAERAAALLPDARLIVLLRNPIDRALSHHQHETRRGMETLSFADALSAEESRLRGEAERIRREPGYRSTAHQWHSYRSRGCYRDQLEQWLRFFKREQMLVLISEEFYADPARSLRQVTDFLVLPPLPPLPADAYEKHNLASYGSMNPALGGELADFYAPHNARLAEFLGRDLGW
jgi:hypothetical protein